MNGFFSPSQLISSKEKKTLTLIPQCNSCGFYKYCKSPKMTYQGKGKRKILIVSESPGEQEDQRGRLFVGKSGQYLEKALRKNGIEMREDCWITNSIICKPPKSNPVNENHIRYCRPNLIKEIRELNPVSIILMGSVAVKSLIGWIWKEDPGEISRWVGLKIPAYRINSYIFPVWHPAYIIRCNDERKDNRVMEKLFLEHLENVAINQKHPGPAPDYKKEIIRLTESEQIIKHIKQFEEDRKPIAFDYETDRLKPDTNGSKIICCAISNGTTTISFPLFSDIIDAWKSLLVSDCPKIGFNSKFEDRWTRAYFGISVNNWIWDGMLAAHVIDNRREFCSLKFQSFILLGMESYDDHIKPFLSSSNSNSPNRIKDIYFNDLLLYCGIDALLEYKVAKIQMEKLNASY